MVGFQAEKGDLIEAEKFSDNKSYVLHLIHSKAYEKAAELATDKEVLDLGCNTGYGSKIINRVSEKTTGVDVSKKAVEKARRLYASENIDFQVIDGKKLSFADSSFDLIVSFQVIEHIVAHESYLEEIKRVLAPGGIVVFTTPNRLIRLYPGMKPWNEFHVTEYDSEELKNLLNNFFDKVEVLGLFTKDPLYTTELNRVGQIRERARIKQNTDMNTLYKNILLLAMNLKASLLKRLKPQEDFQKKYTTEDLYYLHDNLDNALDLMAICSDQ
jgi:SAM-dependent methyltransferase